MGGAFALLLAAGTVWARWEVLRSDEAGLVAEWTSPAFGVDTVKIEGRTTYRLDLEDASISGKVGAPAIPRVGAFVAVPPGAEAIASAVLGRMEVMKGVLAPAPSYAPRDDGLGYRAVYSMNPEAYAGSLADENWVRIEPVGATHGVALVRIVLAPVRFMPSEGEIVLTRRLTVTVTFARTETLTRTGTFAGLPEAWHEAVLNAAQVGRWARTAPRERRAAVPSPFSSGTWMRLYVTTSGIYQLRASSVIAADERFRGASLNRLAMFGGPGQELPIRPTASRTTTLQTVRPLVVDANSDGLLNGDDYLLFYGKSPSGWHQDPASLDYFYALNRYTEENVYWLAIVDSTAWHAEVRDGTVTDAAAPQIDRCVFRHHEEPETRNFNEEGDSDGPISGLDWEWMSLPSGSAFNIQPTLTDMAGDTVLLRLGQLNEYSVFLPLELSVAGELAAPVDQRQTSTYGWYQGFRAIIPSSSQASVPITIRNTIDIGVEAFLDYYELSYWRRLLVRGGTLDFSLPPLRRVGPDALAHLLLSGVDRTKQRLFDVSDGVGLIEYVLPPADGQGITHVQVSQSGLVERRYLLTTESNWRQPVRLERATPTANLRGRTAGVDYLVVTHPDFLSQAQRLAAARAQLDGFRTAVVTTRDIYDEFALGAFDPTAIRDFLKFAAENWRDGPADPGLRYVVLMGDGQFDYRNLTRFSHDEKNPHPGIWVPPYEEGPLTTDDWFAIFDDTGIPAVQIGRLAVQTLDEAQQVVDKIIAYEENPEHGSWQNQVVMIADDEFDLDRNVNSENYIDDSEALIDSLRPEMVIEKIYSIEYSMNEQLRKPGASRAVVEAWNRGAVLMNYIGHGSPVLWAHERIFVLATDLPSIANGKRLPVLTALTCSAGHFDDPSTQSMAEVLVNFPKGGVIATVAASRLAYNVENVDFNELFLGRLFRQSVRKPRLGDAFWSAKAIALRSPDSFYRTNTRKFVLIGDPATRVALPELPVRVAVDSDSLAALRPVTVHGAVLTPDQQDTLRSFSGTALVHLFDSATPASYQTAGGTTIHYWRTGSAMFRGIAQVSGGLFSIQGILPRELVYGGGAARAVAQVWNDQVDGAGIMAKLPIKPSSVPDGEDTEGPTILFARAGDPDEREPLVDGTEIAPHEAVRVWLSDPSGINVTGAIGHCLLAYFNEDREHPLNLTDQFVNWGSAITGWADLTLPQGQALQRVLVEAWDNRNNFATDSVFVRIGKGQGITLRNVIAYPNPMSDRTTFTWISEGISSDTQADATVRIYTVAGRVVDTVRQFDVSDGPTLVEWRPPRPLPNGVYLYQITLRRRSDGETARVIERVAVISP